MLAFALALAFALIAAPAAHAQQAGPCFTISIPNGWASIASADATTEWRSPGDDAWCRANSNDMPSLADDTQAQLNADYAAPWDAGTWGDVLTVPGEKLEVSASQSEQVDGRLRQTATLGFAADVFGERVTGRIASFVLVGRMVNAMCFTRSDSFDTCKPVFDTAVRSLRPA